METVKQYLKGAYAAIIAALLGIIYYLTQRVDSLKSQNKDLLGENELKKVTNEYEKQKEMADSAESSYSKLRHELLFGSDDAKDR